MKETIYTQNRELSWLRFNERVMDEAVEEGVPAFERLKFISIFTSNLDEFFMIRVGSLYDQTFLAEPQIDNKTGMTADEQLSEIFRAVAPLYKKRDKIYLEVKRRLADKGVSCIGIAELDEMSYRQKLWTHRPLTDFWRVGKGYAAKLEAHGLYTMGDIARCSIGKSDEVYNEELLYRLFGVNAELLIDHAWGWEPCTIADVKAYKPENKSIVSGQVLQSPYGFDKARLVVREMADALALDLVDKGLVTNQLVLTVGYDIENLSGLRPAYQGEVTVDRYGRKIPKHAHGTANLPGYTSSGEDLLRAVTELYDRIVDRNLLIRRLTISANRLLDEISAREKEAPEQLDLFTDYAAQQKQAEEKAAAHAKERKLQEAMLGVKKRYGKNAILKGMNLEEGATAKDQNEKIGGHQA